MFQIIFIVGLFGVAAGSFVETVQAQSREKAQRGFQAENGVGLIVSTEDIVPGRTEVYLQYKFSVLIRLNSNTMLMPSLLLLSGLADETPRAVIEDDGVGGEVLVFYRRDSNDALALGVRLRRYFGANQTGYYVDGGIYAMSNSLAPDGFFFSVNAGRLFQVARRWTLGLDAQLSSRHYSGTVNGLAGVGGIVRYNFSR